ncbi:MAG: sigma-70 family RNA polymerase sigma factor [Planctomycetes bacterium]|nr:sigma-70 family RNA polymerase sigma factor [Planctomycetota bacterium]
MEAPTDETLLQEYLNGNTASFELLVRRHAQELHQFTVRFTGNAVAAEDVVQDTFLQVHTSADRFDPARKFKPWLFTIAANKARDFIRRRKRRRELPFEAQMSGDDEGQRFVSLLSGESEMPDENMALDEKRRSVRAAIDELPENLTEVLVLAYFHRFPYKEIAEIVGIPLGTVKSRLHSAVVMFDKAYKAAVEKEK